MVVLTQFSLTISMMSYSVYTVKDISISVLGTTGPLTSNTWTYGALIIMILSAMAWVRNLEHFRFVFVFAGFLMMATIVMISGYAIGDLRIKGVASTVVAFNPPGFLDMIGFAVYTFEGVGTLMPCM